MSFLSPSSICSSIIVISSPSSGDSSSFTVSSLIISFDLFSFSSFLGSAFSSSSFSLTIFLWLFLPFFFFLLFLSSFPLSAFSFDSFVSFNSLVSLGSSIFSSFFNSSPSLGADSSCGLFKDVIVWDSITTSPSLGADSPCGLFKDVIVWDSITSSSGFLFSLISSVSGFSSDFGFSCDSVSSSVFFISLCPFLPFFLFLLPSTFGFSFSSCFSSSFLSGFFESTASPATFSSIT